MMDYVPIVIAEFFHLVLGSYKVPQHHVSAGVVGGQKWKYDV